MKSQQPRRVAKQHEDVDRPKITVYEISGGQELSIHYRKGKFVMLDGEATVFGSPVRLNSAYEFEGRGVAVATSTRARLHVEGLFEAQLCVTDASAKELHRLFDISRKAALEQKMQGPHILVVGPADTGKSTLCRELINWTFHESSLYNIAFVDVDLGQTAITVPGTISTVFLESCLPIDDEFSNVVPLVFFHGDKTLNAGSYDRYLDLCAYTQQCIDCVAAVRPAYAAGGAIVNTMGWVEGMGYEAISHMIDIFRITDIIVTGNSEELVSRVSADAKTRVRGVSVRQLSKPSKIFVRNRTDRVDARSRQIVRYFSGTPPVPLTPCRIVVQLREVTFIHALSFEELQPQNLESLTLCAVSNSETLQAARTANIAGFVVLLEVGLSSVSLLAPSPGPLPRRILLVAPSLQLRSTDIPPLL